ncbi:hypothetical protein GCM10009775_30000 [Microbacterium aoyamense]|uniref:Sugar ABC transporter ATPase n=1 Tax=Microbacterium aoyamense TaxID=344166 RepID=A0ABP5B870_9MICO|nr:hypothetical protein [Microbacterium aoyamense]
MSDQPNTQGVPDENVEADTASGGAPERNDGGVHGEDEPPRAEDVIPDEDLTLPGSLESIEGSPASPDPEDPGDPTPDKDV